MAPGGPQEGLGNDGAIGVDAVPQRNPSFLAIEKSIKAGLALVSFKLRGQKLTLNPLAAIAFFTDPRAEGACGVKALTWTEARLLMLQLTTEIGNKARGDAAAGKAQAAALIRGLEYHPALVVPSEIIDLFDEFCRNLGLQTFSEKAEAAATEAARKRQMEEILEGREYNARVVEAAIQEGTNPSLSILIWPEGRETAYRHVTTDTLNAISMLGNPTVAGPYTVSPDLHSKWLAALVANMPDDGEDDDDTTERGPEPQVSGLGQEAEPVAPSPEPPVSPYDATAEIPPEEEVAMTALPEVAAPPTWEQTPKWEDRVRAFREAHKNDTVASATETPAATDGAQLAEGTAEGAFFVPDDATAEVPQGDIDAFLAELQTGPEYRAVQAAAAVEAELRAVQPLGKRALGAVSNAVGRVISDLAGGGDEAVVGDDEPPIEAQPLPPDLDPFGAVIGRLKGIFARRSGSVGE